MIDRILIDNIDVIEKALVKKEKARPVEGQYRKHVRPTDLWRVLLEQLGLKISHDHTGNGDFPDSCAKHIFQTKPAEATAVPLISTSHVPHLP